MLTKTTANVVLCCLFKSRITGAALAWRSDQRPIVHAGHCLAASKNETDNIWVFNVWDKLVDFGTRTRYVCLLDTTHRKATTVTSRLAILTGDSGKTWF